MSQSQRKSRGGRMLRLALVSAVLALGPVAGAGAQVLFEDDILPPRGIVWRLAARGFSGIERPRYDGSDYVVDATSPTGARVRLVVDALDGAILERRLITAPPPPGIVVGRPALPGFGWTEEDLDPRRQRQAERLLPPADIPYPDRLPGAAPGPRAPLPEADPGAGRRPGPREAARPNPLGINPDAKGRPADAGPGKPAGRQAGVKPAPAKPAELKPAEAPRASPEAPAPTLKAEPPKAEPLKAEPPAAETPARAPDKPAERAAVSPTPAAKVDAKPEPKAGEPGWTDPPAEAKRPVRVIGGATVVPGAEPKDGAAPQ